MLSLKTVPVVFRHKTATRLLAVLAALYILGHVVILLKLKPDSICILGNGPGCPPIGRWGGPDPSIPPLVSIVILTYNKPELLRLVLNTISNQKTNFVVETIVADNGCFAETRRTVTSSFGKFLNDQNISYNYAPICTNPGYALGNNKAVMEGWVNSRAKWLLFLNDDVALHPNFIQSMVDLAQSKPNAGAVGCMILNEGGDEVLEAGSIVWSDASCVGYGRGRTDMESSDISYARPVDYVSGACLMIESNIFNDYGGFQHELFPNYYEDTDLQMHVQHDLHKEVWLQPLAKLDHHEHGSFGQTESTAMMQKASSVFSKKWHHYLVREHLPAPETPEMLAALAEPGRDLRLRTKGRAKILYMDERLPNPYQGSGFGRAYDNLKIMTDLGHFVTVIVSDDPENWCDDVCTGNLEIKLGIEVIRPRHGSMRSFMWSRVGFYDIVITSRPGGLSLAREILRDMYRYSPFVLVYDCEALTFRRDELLLSESKKLKHSFPGLEPTSRLLSKEIIEKSVTINKEFELELLALADIIITVSHQETQVMHELNDCSKDKDHSDGSKTCKFTTKVHSVGHLMDSITPTKTSFKHRKGILFIGAFHGRMYYNGDAIWYFVTEIFPLIVKESKGTIPLTIAGREIPKVLRESVEQNPIISKHVIFLESPPDLMGLYNQNRLVLAPHLYGAGIQFKVRKENLARTWPHMKKLTIHLFLSIVKLSEAFALGVPVVMSESAAGNFEIKSSDEIGCVGNDVTSFKQCVLDIHSDREKWKRARMNGLDFIQRTHNRATLEGSWSAIIKDAMAMRVTLPTCDPSLIYAACSGVEVTKMCRRGELEYQRMYPDVAKAVRAGYFASAWDHYQMVGSQEGRVYGCCHAPCKFIETQACAMGEALYKIQYPEVAEAMKAGSFESAFDHFRRFGRSEGRDYVCCHEPDECRYDKSARLVAALEYPVPDGLCEMNLVSTRSFLIAGDQELLPTLERCLDLQNRYCTSNSQEEGAQDDEKGDDKNVDDEKTEKGTQLDEMASTDL